MLAMLQACMYLIQVKVEAVKNKKERLKSSGRIMIYSRRVLITARRGKHIHFMMDLQQLMVSHISDMFLQEL